MRRLKGTLMSIKKKCPKCRALVTYSDTLAGSEVMCKSCMSPILLDDEEKMPSPETAPRKKSGGLDEFLRVLGLFVLGFGLLIALYFSTVHQTYDHKR